MFWSQVETNVGIWCACMPALARLIKKVWVDVLGQKLSAYLGHRSPAGIGHSGAYVKSRIVHRGGAGSGSERVKKTVEVRVVYDRRNDLGRAGRQRLDGRQECGLQPARVLESVASALTLVTLWAVYRPQQSGRSESHSLRPEHSIQRPISRSIGRASGVVQAFPSGELGCRVV